MWKLVCMTVLHTFLEERSIWLLAIISTIYSRLTKAAERVAGCMRRTSCSKEHLSCDSYPPLRLECVLHASLEEHRTGSKSRCNRTPSHFQITALQPHTFLHVQLTSNSVPTYHKPVRPTPMLSHPPPHTNSEIHAQPQPATTHPCR